MTKRTDEKNIDLEVQRKGELALLKLDGQVRGIIKDLPAHDENEVKRILETQMARVIKTLKEKGAI